MRELFVVTHPEATHHVEGRVGGWFDSHLTGRGQRHAHQVAEALDTRIDPGAALFTSDLRRTQQTADAIASRLGVTPRALFELREKSYGEGEGQPDPWFRERFVPPPARGERMSHDEGLVGAETKAEWVRRVYAGMDIVMADPAHQKVIVTHAGSATFVIAHWIGVPLSALDFVSFRLDPGSITHLREDDYFHNRTVIALNKIGHIVG
ncbi:histidine phosphatase family protein [Ruania alba]|nr:histidine phosphatase family protein [Ruania alba]